MKMGDYLQQAKSENYQDAEEKGLLKAGEVATRLSKKFGVKITAKELEVFATEWHHAGIFKSGNALKGRRVYFFNISVVDNISLQKILDNRARNAQKTPPDIQLVQGWYVQYFRMTDPKSRKTFNKPFVGIYKGPAHKAPKGFHPLSDEAFATATLQRGREIKAGEQVKF
jgi:hypothetical protein